MAEEQMVQAVQSALSEHGVGEEVVAAGQFMPRGHTGSMFAGGLIGDSLGGAGGDVVDSVATVGGSMAGARLHDQASGLPGHLLVGVTATHVYGFDAAHRHSPAGPMVFQIPRETLEAKVHQRVNVRILELVETTTGSRIELEGSRIPLTHSHDVITALEG
jgi:hypothetical protein